MEAAVYRNPGLGADDIAERLSLFGYGTARLGETRSRITYYDTQDGKLYKRGYRLRFVHGPGRWLLEGGAEITVNAELSGAPAPGATGTPGGATGLSGAVVTASALLGNGGGEPIVRKLLAACGERNLLPLLEARLVEELFAVTAPDGSRSSLSLDEWVYVDPFTGGGSEPERLIRVRAETPGREFSYIGILLRDLFALDARGEDPLSRGLEALGLPLPGAPVPVRYSFTAGDPVSAVFRKTLGAQAFKMRANTEGTLGNLDPEFLHDLRVATRRARFALKHARPFLGKERCEAVGGELDWIAALLGQVRDADVFDASLDEQFSLVEAPEAAREAIAGALSRKRDTYFEALSEALRSSRYLNLLAAIDSLQAAGEGAAALAPALDSDPVNTPAKALDAAPRYILKALKAVAKRGKREAEEFTPEELHGLRIAFKRLRYTCEAFAPLYGGKMGKAIRSFVAFQDCLGRHQDTRTALAILEGILGDLFPGAGRDVALSIGALLRLQRERASREREVFLRLWQGFPRIAKKVRRALRARVRPASRPSPPGPEPAGSEYLERPAG